MIEINNRTDYEFPLSELKNLATGSLPKEGDLSIAFLSSKEIAQFNERYRKKKGPTDVLSFEGEDSFVGEILISPEVVEKQAKEYGLDFKEEIRRVLVHGILHLSGYDHKEKEDKKKMRRKEKELLSG